MGELVTFACVTGCIVMVSATCIRTWTCVYRVHIVKVLTTDVMILPNYLPADYQMWAA